MSSDVVRGIRRHIATLILAFVPSGPVVAQDLVSVYAAHLFEGDDGTVMPYRLFVPGGPITDPLPLVVYLHGAGGSGTDNRQQLALGNVVGTGLFASSELQARHPSFVVVPQAPMSHTWYYSGSDGLSPYGRLVTELVEGLIDHHDIDPDRVYLTGISRGGRGTWDISAKRPDLFAAAVPSCGAGTPSRAAALRDLPIWAFHGSADATVPVWGTRDMVAALRALGSSVQYTEYPGLGHEACVLPYADPELTEWLFQQRR